MNEDIDYPRLALINAKHSRLGPNRAMPAFLSEQRIRVIRGYSYSWERLNLIHVREPVFGFRISTSSS